MLDACYSHLYFCQSLNRLQRGLSAIAELLVMMSVCCAVQVCTSGLIFTCGPEVLFKTCVTMKFVDDDD